MNLTLFQLKSVFLKNEIYYFYVVGAALEAGYILRIFRGKLDAPHHADTQSPALFYGFFHAAHAVVVRNGHHVDAHGLGARHDNSRRLLAIAVIRMQMQIGINHLWKFPCLCRTDRARPS